jgi:hypothetical protein
MIALKRLWARWTGGVLVYLLDHDGEVTTRVATPTPFGLSCCRHGLGIGPVLLLADGRVQGAGYVTRWGCDDKDALDLAHAAIEKAKHCLAVSKTGGER